MKKLEWADETIVEWLQLYPNVKKCLVEVLVRRYKNLIYKEIAKQCDQRYDREDIIQQIVYLFIQLLEEYDYSRGIPLAGFLKIKLPNRIYNHFKSQLKVWDVEIPHEGLVSASEGKEDGENEYDDICELKATTVDINDFWVGMAQVLEFQEFQALFWKFECECGTDEIAVLMELRGPCDAEKMLNTTLEGLRYNERIFCDFTFDPSQKTGTTSKALKKENVDMTYHIFQILHQEVADFCGIFPHGEKTVKQLIMLNKIYTKGQNLIYRKFDDFIDFIIYRCGCIILEDTITTGERSIC